MNNNNIIKSSVVTSIIYFKVPSYKSPNIDPESVQTTTFKLDFDHYFLSLIKRCAYRIYIPNHIVQCVILEKNGKKRFESYKLNIKPNIRSFPEELQKRIKYVDENDKYFELVDNYLEPLLLEIMDTPCVYDFWKIFDFIYKILLANIYKAEADVINPRELPLLLRNMRKYIIKSSPRIIINEIESFINIYNLSAPLPTVTINPQIVKPSIYHRLIEILETAEFKKIQQERHLLGFNKYLKSTLLTLKAKCRNIVESSQFKPILKLSLENIKLLSPNIVKPSVSIPEFLKDNIFNVEQYSPPILNLSLVRDEITKYYNIPDAEIIVSAYYNSLMWYRE